MKKLIVLSVILFSTISWAQQIPPPQQPISHEDGTKLRDGVEALQQVLNAVPTKEQVKEKAQDLTLGVAANKIADLTTQVVGQLSSSIHKVAPEVWRVMIRQQYAKAAGELLPPLIWFFFALTLRLVTPKWWKKPSVEGIKSSRDADSENAAWIIIVVIIPTLLTLGGIAHLAINLASTAQYIINPEFYAIRDLLILITKPSVLLN